MEPDVLVSRPHNAGVPPRRLLRNRLELQLAAIGKATDRKPSVPDVVQQCPRNDRRVDALSRPLSLRRIVPMVPRGQCAGGPHLPRLINDVRMNGTDVLVRQFIVKSTHALRLKRSL